MPTSACQLAIGHAPHERECNLGWGSFLELREVLGELNCETPATYIPMSAFTLKIGPDTTFFTICHNPFSCFLEQIGVSLAHLERFSQRTCKKRWVEQTVARYWIWHQGHIFYSSSSIVPHILNLPHAWMAIWGVLTGRMAQILIPYESQPLLGPQLFYCPFAIKVGMKHQEISQGITWHHTYSSITNRITTAHFLLMKSSSINTANTIIHFLASW